LRAAGTAPLPWIGVAPGAPYFVDEGGRPWHPIGQNDAISWVELDPLFRRRDVAAVDRHLAMLKQHGVGVLRLMMEYAQVRHRYLERPAGTFVPNMVQLWDDLFALCEKHGLRVLLTPYDTFWMWLHFRHHPYAGARGGPLPHPSQALLDPAMRAAIKARLSFATARWGGSGVIFAWDIWNEIHPAQGGDSADAFDGFIADIGGHLRAEEMRLHGRAHIQTVSIFGPELVWRPHLAMEGAIFRHPALDAATVHIYEQGTIDDPRNTVDAAMGMGRIVREAIGEIRDGRPFFDSEHGPIHSFKDKHRKIPEAFDDEYFRHMQWAHLAAGGAGGGMRWPNRTPHVLTAGMRRAQRALADFMPSLDWARFDRRSLGPELVLRDGQGAPIDELRLARFACASRDQALVYLLARDRFDTAGMVRRDGAPLSVTATVPGLVDGRYRVLGWDTLSGRAVSDAVVDSEGGRFMLPPFAADLAVAIVGQDR
jgi:mannan endo-1,4-beta-mannosidase